jgi:membrane protein YdbS with pleckstrin-like domain
MTESEAGESGGGMRTSAIVQMVVFLAVAVGLALVVIYVADGWADWVVFAGIVVTAVGGVMAYHNREYPYATKKRTITRDADSRW